MARTRKERRIGTFIANNEVTRLSKTARMLLFIGLERRTRQEIIDHISEVDGKRNSAAALLRSLENRGFITDVVTKDAEGKKLAKELTTLGRNTFKQQKGSNEAIEKALEDRD